MVFSDYFVEHNKIVKNRTILLGACNVIIYIVLRFWTYHNPPIYVLKEEYIANIFYVGNTVVGFAFLIMYLAIYSATVMRMESIERLEMLRKRISDNTMIYCGNKIKVTVTIGLTFCADGKTLDEIIKEADAKLYEGKENGRNQVVC